METTQSSHVAAGFGVLALLLALAVGVALYVFLCFCCKRICEKAGQNPGVLIWIPIVQILPLLRVAGMPDWMILLLLIPFVNLVVLIMMWVKVCSALGKSPWLVLMMFIPVVNLAFIPYLAFAD